jgi:ABC-type Fe3+-hydroxamate transport system substrate-binding protein
VRGRVLIALAVLAALAGCQESGFDESKETQRPLKVQHALNPLTGTKVPGVAKRPMTLSSDTLGDTLALGVKPVRAALPGGRLPDYLRSAARGVEVVPPLTKLDLAATEAADPDLILGTKEGDGGLYDRLSRIAPTVMSEGDDWKLNLRLHGEALGRTNDAEKLLIDWDDRVARLRDAIGDRKVSLLLIRPNDAPASPGPVGEAILADLGIRPRAHGRALLRIETGPEWSSGGLLAARAALADVEQAL